MARFARFAGGGDGEFLLDIQVEWRSRVSAEAPIVLSLYRFAIRPRHEAVAVTLLSCARNGTFAIELSWLVGALPSLLGD